MDSMALMDLGGGVGIFGTLLIGGLAGWIASKVMKTDNGILLNIIIGIVGAYIGAFLANALGIKIGLIFSGWFIGNLVVAIVGAVVLIWIYRLIKGGKN